MKQLDRSFFAASWLHSCGYGLGITLLAFTLLLPSVGQVYANDSERLRAGLERDDWQNLFSSKDQREELDKDFDELVELAWNKGIDYRIRLRGVILLSKTRDVRRADVLSKMFHNPFFNAGCPDIKSSLMTALGNVDNDKESIETLLEGMNDVEILVREAAVRSLGRLGARKAVPFLIGRLYDKSFAIRRSVIESLGQIGDQRVVPLLEKIADEDRDDLIRMEARVSLTRMKS